MSSVKMFSPFLFVIFLILCAGCISPNNEVKYVYITVTPTLTPTPGVTPVQVQATASPHVSGGMQVSTGKGTASPSPTPPRYKPKFEWGDILEDPYGYKYIILEGHPEISGVYNAYKMIYCPCVRKESLNAQETDRSFRKVGTQNPNTICSGAKLTVLTNPQDSCYYPNSVVL